MRPHLNYTCLTSVQICDRFINRRLIQKFYDRVLAIGLQGYAKLYVCLTFLCKVFDINQFMMVVIIKEILLLISLLKCFYNSGLFFSIKFPDFVYCLAEYNLSSMFLIGINLSCLVLQIGKTLKWYIPFFYFYSLPCPFWNNQWN